MSRCKDFKEWGHSSEECIVKIKGKENLVEALKDITSRSDQGPSKLPFMGFPLGDGKDDESSKANQMEDLASKLLVDTQGVRMRIDVILGQVAFNSLPFKDSLSLNMSLLGLFDSIIHRGHLSYPPITLQPSYTNS